MKDLRKILVLAMVFGAGGSYSAEIYVPGSYTTIQAAVNAANTGDTITVSAGTWTEAVYINKGIALIGVGIPIITSFELSHTNTVTFDGTTTDNASISGFTITGAMGGDGIYCNNGSPFISNNTISGNSEHGIYCSYFSFPTIINNIILKNGRDGICYNYYYGGNFFSTIANNTISRNGGSGIDTDISFSLNIINNIITENGYYGIGHAGGVTPIPTINYNCVWGNGYNYSGCSPGPNDISQNPQFIGEGDYHLGTTSPCIDAGTDTVPAYLATDADGNPRKIGGHIDIGAYEYDKPDVITTSLPDGQIDVYYFQTLSAAGGIPPYTWSWISGSLPNGLAPLPSGIILGIPIIKPGTFTFTTQVADQRGRSISKKLNIYIAPRRDETEREKGSVTKLKEESKDLEELLETHRANLRKLEKDAAVCGLGEVPLKLQNQIEYENSEIKDKEKKLKEINEKIENLKQTGK